MELLSPAGSKEALIAAVQSGADAVYLGGSKFSARASAENFTEDEMKRQLDYCHVRGVDVHVAANILVKENERNEFIDYVGKLNEMGVDALIIQDIGMASEIRKTFPDLALHASTQMTSASADSVKYLENMGFSRAVLARELSFQQIKSICEKTSAEIEVFVHGALCMCYSGQCLMSSIIGGRSGNRGMCAQPCRLSYEMAENNKIIRSGYLLSPKDNALLDEIEKLKDIGVDSLKIEGRLKRPEYVAAVTKTYRKAIDFAGRITNDDWKTLENAFNRSGFTKGYFIDKKGPQMMSLNNPGNVSDNIFSEDTKKRCHPDADFKKIEIDAYVSFKNKRPMELTFIDSDCNTVTVKSEQKAETALNRPLLPERIEEQLKKLGGTPFKIRKIEIDADEGITIPVSEINALRREAVSKLEELRCAVMPRRVLSYNENDSDVKDGKSFSAEVKTYEQAKAVISAGINRVYLPHSIAEKIKKEFPDSTVISVLPPIWKEGNTSDFCVCDGVLISNIGQTEHFDSCDLYGSFRLNVCNNRSIEHFKYLKTVQISPELNIKEIRKLIPSSELEVIAYGRLPLMVMENCPKKAHGRCGADVVLKDRMNEEFPLVCGEGCFSELLNSKPLYMADRFDELLKLPVNVYKLVFTLETPSECVKIVEDYMRAFNGEKVEAMKENTFTRGHYYRGVE